MGMIRWEWKWNGNKVIPTHLCADLAESKGNLSPRLWLSHSWYVCQAPADILYREWNFFTFIRCRSVPGMGIRDLHSPAEKPTIMGILHAIVRERDWKLLYRIFYQNSINLTYSRRPLHCAVWSRSYFHIFFSIRNLRITWKLLVRFWHSFTPKCTLDISMSIIYNFIRLKGSIHNTINKQ